MDFVLRDHLAIRKRFINNHRPFITRETQKESYDNVIESLGERQKLIYEHLKNHENGATAKELAISLFQQNLVPSPERNSTHPRLNELVEKGLVVVIGKKTCQYTNRKVAVYRCKK
ncbi:hypothetical protein IEN91_04415 [Bacillus velezensis]|uniref:hypothetical protein n=1 Tax=Bacillus velezensis TaxID=492670 RepID=UPI0018C7BAD3|nr:hypothetical protein [Bacillus velezensis]QPK89698.1 hypothetical protein IEN91_04415 [Bacillus velezensis]